MAYDAFSQKMAIIVVLDFPNTSSDLHYRFKRECQMADCPDKCHYIDH